ncbi:REP-associated tyrosine transposase [Moorena producens]|uniref:REP-associated tyrosine transposase n=1 Tax=Moorena producens TaxID=1155739 RepID=UPI003C709265
MPKYRRPHVPGGTYFITQVTYQRVPWLCSDIGKKALREAIAKVREKYLFSIEAFVLLPDHFHCLWTLPPDDPDFSVRLRLIKTYVTKHYAQELGINRAVSLSRQKRKESNLWQRRCWEPLILNERDFAHHCDYIHDNPVRHRLCKHPQDWQYSSIHRFIAQGIYPTDWVEDGRKEKPQGIWDE